MATDIDKFVHDQLSVWPAVAAKYRALKSTRTRTLPFGGILVTLQSNPGRLPIFDHGCPLCEENYMEHQHTLPFEGRKGRKYNILVNRAPIFPRPSGIVFRICWTLPLRWTVIWCFTTAPKAEPPFPDTPISRPAPRAICRWKGPQNGF